jgi:hypothetical protein
LVWNDELLFLHPQKTAGMAVSTLLWDILKTPVFNSVPLDHWDRIIRPGVAQVLGIRHENLYEAAAILEPFRRSLSDFRAIITVMRNPYDMEVSRYFHLRKPGAFEATEDILLARTLRFEEFQLKSRFRTPRPHNPELEFAESIKNYYAMGASFPENLKIIRYENLEAELNEQLQQLGYEAASIPIVNTSDERAGAHHNLYITNSEVENAVYQRYKWIFDHGFYQRLFTASSKPAPNETS